MTAGATLRRPTEQAASLGLVVLAIGLVGAGIVATGGLSVASSDLASVATGTRPAAMIAPSTGLTRRADLAALPLAAREAVSRGLGLNQPSFAVRRTSPGQLGARDGGLAITFARGGAVLTGASRPLRLGLTAVGRGGSAIAVRPIAPRLSAGNQVTYARPGLSEWYANGPLGLEQGFALTRRPAGAGPLTLDVGRVAAGVTARVLGDGSALIAGGLRYGELTVTDAAGRSLAARIALVHGRILLEVADAGARYPLRIDPLAQLAELTASQPTSGDSLGTSIAVSGDGTTVVATAFFWQSDTGTAYVFTEPAGGWANAPVTDTQAAQLIAPDGAAGDELGLAEVGITSDGSTIAVGAPGHANGQGAVYVFSEPAGGWAAAASPDSTAAELIPNDAAAGSQLGFGVAISADGSTVAAGEFEADGDNGQNSGQGLVDVFTKPAGGWSSAPDPDPQTAELVASDGASNDELGNSVAVSADGSTIAAGALHHANTGAVYIYSEPNGGWRPPASSTPNRRADPLHQPLDPPGFDVPISSDDSMVVGVAPQTRRLREQGAALVFPAPAGGWAAPGPGTPVAVLTASDASSSDSLGQSVAISGDAGTILAGSGEGPRMARPTCTTSPVAAAPPPRRRTPSRQS